MTIYTGRIFGSTMLVSELSRDRKILIFSMGRVAEILTEGSGIRTLR